MESSQVEVTRRYSKYIFLDVVKFSKRSAEAQSEIVSRLNSVVIGALPIELTDFELNCILIPTGDGMCIALLKRDLPYDTHIQTALKILQVLDNYNNSIKDETRKFQVRVGINQNTDILVTDINGKLNVAGAGINLAARIMDKADGGQVLVSQTVYAELQPSEIYMDKFKRFFATDKHGERFEVFQFVDGEYIGLNIDTPNAFKVIEKEEIEPELNEVAAYFIAHAIRNKDKVFELKDNIRHIDVKATVLFWMLAEAYTKSIGGKLVPSEPRWLVAHKPFKEQLEAIGEIDFIVLLKFFGLIRGALNKYNCYFEEADMYEELLFPNEKAAEKLAHSWPQIWEQLQLDEVQQTN
jgi:hypothetical protein